VYIETDCVDHHYGHLAKKLFNLAPQKRIRESPVSETCPSRTIAKAQ